MIVSIHFACKQQAQFPTIMSINLAEDGATEDVIPKIPPAKKYPEVDSLKINGIKNTTTNTTIDIASKNALSRGIRDQFTSTKSFEITLRSVRETSLVFRYLWML